MAAKAWKNRTRSRNTCKHEPDYKADPDTYGERLREFWDKAEQQVCAYGNCSQSVCFACRKITTGVGPMGCPCDLTRGWNRSRVEQMGKPAAPVKAKGRHGDRIRRRQREMRKVRTQYGRWLYGGDE